MKFRATEEKAVIMRMVIDAGSTHKLELQISYRVCVEVSQENNLWRTSSTDREDTARFIYMERNAYL